MREGEGEGVKSKVDMSGYRCERVRVREVNLK